jgi:hypothetical protein
MLVAVTRSFPFEPFPETASRLTVFAMKADGYGFAKAAA